MLFVSFVVQKNQSVVGMQATRLPLQQFQRSEVSYQIS
jgi:hypothetical protein